MSYDEPLVVKKTATVKDADVEKTLEELRKMRQQEVLADRAATIEDMVSIDLEIKKDNVIIEGGVSKNYRIYLHEKHYIPGFSEQLIGLKKGDDKSFELAFPKEHYQKHLAGTTVSFSVHVNDVYELKLPELNEDFAKSVGVESIEKLRELLKTNLTKEADQKADEAAEIELLEKLVSGSKFSEIPELLITEEIRRMYTELEHAAEQQGMNMNDYLAQLKKSADEIKLDMAPQAIRRVQTAVLIKEISKKEKIEIADDEVNTEIDRILNSVKDKETRERVSSPEYRDYVATQLKNRRALETLKKKAVKES